MLDAGQWRTLAGMAAVILGLHVVGFFLLLVVVAPHSYSLGASGAFTVGVGIAAYTLGMRHAFDADHIAAIDNSTRKLMGEGKRPLSVGFFFSLGHSTIVFVLAFLFALGIRALSGQVENDGSTLHNATGWIGTGVSGTFLYVIAALNIAILVGVLRILDEMKRGSYDEAELERQLDNRGLMNRFYRRFTKTVTKPWQMYPIGVLFGLGFDTATEVALLFLAAAGAGAGLPFYAIICLPILFAAGMTLFDTIDGSFMNFAYGWAFSKPVRKIYYNITITALSVFVALVIGSIEIGGLLAEKFGLTGGAWDWIAGVDLNTVGFLVVGLFVLTWIVALAIWHFASIEERWSASIKVRQ
ncbi:MAG: nickel/cobalt transporter (NiCoT) family protein [Solirubrobacterales bacterium]|jgi:high-affinity nickel-transport protein|nr:nickel/cobalt transporter (NiCoT) family protein [Solirubrobacterales bacterium]